MFYSLYDKNFNALGVRKTYPCNNWSLKRKANAFDECILEGMAIENSDGAMYVGLHNNDGSLKYLALSGIPETYNGITKINGIDLKQLFNNDAIIDLTGSTVGNLTDLYSELLTCIFMQHTNIGITTELPDLRDVANMELMLNSIERERAVGNVWKTIQAVNAIYDCYIEFNWDLLSTILIEKRIQFRVKRVTNEISIKLEDFGKSKIKKDYTGVNRAVCMLDGGVPQVTYYLLSDDRVVIESEAIQEVNQSKIIYPANIKIYEEANLETAKLKAIEELYKNRFKANIEIDLDEKLGYMLKNINLNTKADIYGYKKLPVMEIYEDSNGKKKIKFGRLEEFWWV